VNRNALLPWVIPGTLVVAVLFGALAGSLLVGIVLVLVGYVGVPMAYFVYERTRQELREADAPAGPAGRPRSGRTRR
jgi:Flp pilus assembly protein TadB